MVPPRDSAVSGLARCTLLVGVATLHLGMLLMLLKPGLRAEGMNQKEKFSNTIISTELLHTEDLNFSVRLHIVQYSLMFW